MSRNGFCRALIKAMAAGSIVLPLISTTPTTAQQEHVRRFDFTIIDGRLVGGMRTIQVRRGETLELQWSSDRQLTLHLHGYDLKLGLQPGTPGIMRFDARATGRFLVEIHSQQGRHAGILYLEVHPK